jgi:hypothetical protein
MLIFQPKLDHVYKLYNPPIQSTIPFDSVQYNNNSNYSSKKKASNHSHHHTTTPIYGCPLTKVAPNQSPTTSIKFSKLEEQEISNIKTHIKTAVLRNKAICTSTNANSCTHSNKRYSLLNQDTLNRLKYSSPSFIYERKNLSDEQLPEPSRSANSIKLNKVNDQSNIINGTSNKYREKVSEYANNDLVDKEAEKKKEKAICRKNSMRRKDIYSFVKHKLIGLESLTTLATNNETKNEKEKVNDDAQIVKEENQVSVLFNSETKLETVHVETSPVVLNLKDKEDSDIDETDSNSKTKELLIVEDLPSLAVVKEEDLGVVITNTSEAFNNTNLKVESSVDLNISSNSSLIVNSKPDSTSSLMENFMNNKFEDPETVTIITNIKESDYLSNETILRFTANDVLNKSDEGLSISENTKKDSDRQSVDMKLGFKVFACGMSKLNPKLPIPRNNFSIDRGFLTYLSVVNHI